MKDTEKLEKRLEELQKERNEKLKKENSELSEFMANIQDKQQDSGDGSGNGSPSEGGEVSEGGVSLSRFEAIKGLLKSRDISLNNKKKQVEVLNKKIKELEEKAKSSGKATLKDSDGNTGVSGVCLLYTSTSPRDRQKYRMPSSA